MRFSFIQSWIVTLSVISMAAGCSSVPDYKPSKPITESTSLGEIAEICDEYTLEGQYDSEQKPKPLKKIALVPWVRCMEKAITTSNQAKDSEMFAMLFNDLSNYHALGGNDAELPNWNRLNAIMRASFQRILSELRMKDPTTGLSYPRPFTEDEIAAMQEIFPSYLHYLEQSGRVARAEGDVSFQKKIVKIRPPKELNDEQLGYCRKYLGWQMMQSGMDDLQQYKKTLEQSKGKNGPQIQRIERRLNVLKSKSSAEEKQLKTAFAGIQKNASWFKSEHCH